MAPATIRARASGLTARFGFPLAADLAGAGFGADALAAGFAAVFLEAGAPFLEADAVGAGAPFFRAAQRAFIDAASFARPSGVSPPFFLLAVAAAGLAFGADVVPFTFAHRARAAAAIFSRASADIGRRPFLAAAGFAAGLGVGADVEYAPLKMETNSDWSLSICSEISRARFSWAMEGLLLGMAE